MAEHVSADQSWRTAPFRQKIVAQIDEAIRQCSSPIGRNSAEMENHVYNKAKTKDEYLSFVARLILHIREMKVPMSYFPSGGAGGGQQMGSLNQQTLATQNPQLGAALSNSPVGSASNVMQGGGGPTGSNNMPMSSVHGGLQSLIGSLGSSAGPGGQHRAQMAPNSAQQIMQQLPMTAKGAGTAKQQQQQQQAMMQQQKQMQQHNIHNVTSMASMPPPSKPMTSSLGSFPPGMGDGQMINMRDSTSNQAIGPVQQFFSQNVNSSGIIPRQSAPINQQFLGHSPGSTTNHGGIMQVPSPAQQIPPNMTSSQMAPSPVGYLPSHSPQIVPSPIGSSSSVPTPPVRAQGQLIGAPSPSSALNTPINSVGLASSPVSRNQEDKVYLEKVKQLSKYIEPLRRMIARIDKDEDKKKELSKMKNLLDILSNPSKRLPMDTLLKCEQVLEKLELKIKPGEPTLSSFSGPGSGSGPGSAHQSSTGFGGLTQSGALLNIHTAPHHQHLHHLPGNKEYNLCQPLLDAIVGHLGLPTFSNTLQKTFAPAFAVLHGTSFGVSAHQSKKFRLESCDADIPDVLQGEIARLDQRFKVNLDPIENSASKTVHLMCQLDDRNLPCVPPIMLIVPTSYPQRAPKYVISSEEYESTKFLKKIHETLLERLAKMPDQFSVTAILETWEMSVRHSCAIPSGTPDSTA